MQEDGMHTHASCFLFLQGTEHESQGLIDLVGKFACRALCKETGNKQHADGVLVMTHFTLSVSSSEKQEGNLGLIHLKVWTKRRCLVTPTPTVT